MNKLYERRKHLVSKEGKTKEAMLEVLKRAQQKANKEIQSKKQSLAKQQKSKTRKSFWFEKFYWYLSSEGYLVLSARDQQQNELLIKKYLTKEDIVFHAHIQGAAFTIIKNHTSQPVSLISIQEAAVVSISHSKAWSQNVVSDVYWVYAEQVSKTAPTGMSLPNGSFMIYGKKNFINPFKLELGFGLLFRVEKESLQGRPLERSIKNVMLETQGGNQL